MNGFIRLPVLTDNFSMEIISINVNWICSVTEINDKNMPIACKLKLANNESYVSFISIQEFYTVFGGSELKLDGILALKRLERYLNLLDSKKELNEEEHKDA